MYVFSKWTMALAALCFFSLDFAHAQNVHGVLRVVKGDVQVQTAKGETTKGRIGGKVFPKDVVITGKDARAKIVMIDNNEINVSPESRVEIQNYEYDPNGGKKDVLLNVIYGKVRSKVEQKYDGKTSKFQIKTPSAVAGVRGTDFLMGFNRTDRSSQVVTFEGKVEFGRPGPGGTIANPVMVAPGQFASIQGNTQAPSAPAAVPKEDLRKMDGETKNELPKTESSATPTSGAAPSEAKEEKKTPAAAPTEDKKSEGGAARPTAPATGTVAADAKEGSGPGPSTSPAAPRGPSAVAGNGPGGAGPVAPPSGSMFRPEDFAHNNVPVLPVGPTVPGLLPQVPINNLRPCDFCNTVIQDGQTKLIIKVNGP